MNADPGYFGPNSMMWKVNKEITVLFGGARALLMHAAHPLIAAGARQTSFYQRDPWKRLIRTLSLQNSVTFGTKQEADDSANRINKLHEVINGDDEITGEEHRVEWTLTLDVNKEKHKEIKEKSKALKQQVREQIETEETRTSDL